METLSPAIERLAKRPEASRNQDLAIGLTAAARCDVADAATGMAMQRLDRATAILDKIGPSARPAASSWQ